jgi:hypothetical protein
MKKQADHSAHLRNLRESEAARLGLSVDASIVQRRSRLLLAVALIDGRLCRGEVVSSAELIDLDRQLSEHDPMPMPPCVIEIVEPTDYICQCCHTTMSEAEHVATEARIKARRADKRAPVVADVAPAASAPITPPL